MLFSRTLLWQDYNLYLILATFLILSLSAVVASEDSKQLTVKPGDSIVDGSHIKPFLAKYLLVTTSADGEETSRMIWDYEVKITEENGKKLLHRILNGFDAEGNQLQSRLTVVEQKTLKPVSWEFEITGGPSASATIDGGKVKIKQQMPGTAEPIEVEFDLGMPIFDYINMHGILLLGFPLEKGFSAKFPYFNSQPTGGLKLEWQTIQVNGLEKVDSGPKKNIEAWLVETGDGWKFWLTKEAPYVIKVIAPDPGGGQRFFELM